MAAPSDTALRATVVVYGRADGAGLSRTLASVVAQSERRLEIVVLAPDALLAGLRTEARLDDPRILACVDDLAQPAVSLATALERARGAWVKLVPASSTLDAGCIARELAVAEAAAGTAAVFSLPDLVDESGAPVTDREVRDGARPEARDATALRRELLQRNVVAPATVLFSREATAALGGIETDLPTMWAESLWLRLCHHRDVVLLAEELARVPWQPRPPRSRDAARAEHVDIRFRVLAELRARAWRPLADASPDGAALLALAGTIQRAGLRELTPFAHDLVARARAMGTSAQGEPALETLLHRAPELARAAAWHDRHGAAPVAEAASTSALAPAAAVVRRRLSELVDDLADAGRARQVLHEHLDELVPDLATGRVVAERSRDVTARVLDKLRLTHRVAGSARRLLRGDRAVAFPGARAASGPSADAPGDEVLPAARGGASEHSAALREIVTNHPAARETVLFAPTLRWTHELFQRPHQLARELARQGHLVFYLEGLWPAIGEGGFTALDERLYAATVPLETFAPVRSPVVFFLSYNALDLRCLTEPRTVYEMIDELEVFRGDQADIRRIHAHLLATADVVVTTARRLQTRVRPVRPDALLSPNAVEYQHFARARAPGALPDDLARIVRPGHPIVGYYGALASWLDYDLIRFAALERPDLEFVLIGPDYDGSLARTDVLALANVHRLDARRYEDLPSYLRAFDVATIPFLVNAITDSTSPIKLFEYMAAGKPVVATAMHECRFYPGALVAEDGVEFVALLERALELARDDAYREQLDAVARANTWAARVEQIMGAVAAAGTGRPRRAAGERAIS